MKKLWMVVLVAALCFAFSPMLVQANPIIDFDVIAPGSISYAGGTSPLVGTGIKIDAVSALGPGGVLASFPILNGLLSFTTGGLTGTTSSTWQFGGGQFSSILITGTVDVNKNGIVDAGDITGVLLSGNFGSATVFALLNNFKIAGSTFFDTKNPALLALLNGTGPYSGSFNISFLATGLPPSAFTSSQVLSGDVVNNPVVPEPATMLLLGSGLIGLAGLARRKFRK